ncbi:MAG: polyprenyl synthetase family protein [Atopobiaceae bacterium]|nr:polyprenyl synthetase family protein [Atopobiaceae bacterium]
MGDTQRNDAQASFIEYIERYRELVDDTLLNCPQTTDNHEIETYLHIPVMHFLAGGGKRTRPIMCLLACEAVGGSVDDALITACSIERFQTAAIIHDDICDEGELRRGQPCLHKSEGVGIALNCGDAALVSVNACILSDEHLSDAVKLRVLRELTAMMEKTCEGQALDVGWARDGRWDIGINDYLVMATNKTAHYSGAVPLALGAIVGGGSDEQIEALRSFGLDAGLAFQLQDDLLNLVGDPETQGKDFRTDITEGKRTLVVVHALSHLTGDEREEFLSILSSHETDPARLARAVELMEKTDSINYCHRFAESLVERAKKELEAVELEGWALETLTSMADFFVERLG